MNKTKKIAAALSGITLALAMGLQTFVFGKNDLQTLKAEVAMLKTQIEAMKQCCDH